MSDKLSKCLCAVYVAVPVLIFVDVLARGPNSLYGRFFFWLAGVGGYHG